MSVRDSERDEYLFVPETLGSLVEVKSSGVSTGAVTDVYSIVLDCRRKLFVVCTENVLRT